MARMQANNFREGVRNISGINNSALRMVEANEKENEANKKG